MTKQIIDERYPAEIKLPFDLGNKACEYRLPNDPEKMVRFHAPTPEGLNTVLYSNTSVNGITFRLKQAMQFALDGYERTLVLEAEPTNAYDKNAIAIHGAFRDKDGSILQLHIGYVPKGIAKKIRGDKDDREFINHVATELYPKLLIMFLPTETDTPGFRFDIWTYTDEFGKGSDDFELLMSVPVIMGGMDDGVQAAAFPDPLDIADGPTPFDDYDKWAHFDSRDHFDYTQ